MKTILELPSAWMPYMDVTSFDEFDDAKVPECSEKIMQLIAGITGIVNKQRR